MFQRIILLLLLPVFVWAGNPDRQGEAGAYELLLSPWGQSSGLNLLNTSNVSGVEAMRLNPAGMYIDHNTEVLFGNTQVMLGAGLQIFSAGFAQKVGKVNDAGKQRGTMSFNINALNFGDIETTNVFQPAGDGSTFSPSFLHLAAGYSHSFKDKIFVGFLVRGISETVTDVQAFGAALDAGIQYKGGKDDRFRLGVSLRNIGPSMIYRGEGLTRPTDSDINPANGYLTTFYFRTQKFELPTTLNMGISYDFKFTGGTSYLRTMANFTSNAFARDAIGLGAEFNFKNFLMLRASYKYNLGTVVEGTNDVYTGLGAGFSVNVRTNKEKQNRVGIDYAYRTTLHFNGTHNIGIRLMLF